MQKVIITGSEGLIGREITKFLKKNGFKVIRCSRSLGQDLTNENFVKNWFKKNKANHLIKGHGRMLVRKSGTESKIRIMGESENKSLLIKCVNIVKNM